jgi:pimeloyl-ACP methyl ester carboxylesterase
LPPDDPTPLSPIGFQLALADPHPSVLYLARPCQLTRITERKDCHIKLWTSARFSSAVVNTTNKAIDRYIKSTISKKIIIIGYSGGGAVAALVAAFRNDIIGIVTVSGTLNHEAWTSHHKVTPLYGSLNPTNFSTELKEIPQFHFIGENDEVMPIKIAKSYVKSLGQNNKSKLLVLKNYNHSCCWVKNWAKLLKIIKFIN